MINELKMQELKDLFFYTFGIVPLQNYNAIGDGMTDNRLKIQQAIYDAIQVGAKYIFVPRGNYYYSNTLFKKDEVIFVGNNADTYIKDVEIRQFPDLWNEAQASSSALVPVGGVILYAGTNIPANYLECNGQTVNTSDYSSLYESLNGTNNQDDTFAIPNLTTGNVNTKYIIRAK
jgi:polygalacturonase